MSSVELPLEPLGRALRATVPLSFVAGFVDLVGQLRSQSLDDTSEETAEDGDTAPDAVAAERSPLDDLNRSCHAEIVRPG